MALRFQFDERKGTEALAYIAAKWPNVTIFYASKVLFFAEKKHLNAYGRPIVADTFIAMPNGPVPSTLYDFIKGNLGQSGDPEGFREAIDTANHPRIAAKRPFNNEALSATDIECIDAAIAYCRPKGFGHLSQLTHQERAWSEAYANSAMDYELFIDEDNPNRNEIISEAREFAACGVL
ncbi:MAG TPA: Panacea domain-containing protein [Sphingomonas sp.]|nr:Panacea domain-containing protein [Sphingomonas sp.]